MDEVGSSTPVGSGIPRKNVVFIALLILAIIIGAAVWFVFSNKYSPLASDTEPVLHNLGGVTLAPYDSATGLAGDIKFDRENIDPTSGKEMKLFIFGQKLPKNSPSEPQRLNPNFEFDGIARQIDLIAAIDGTVASIESQPETNDFELFLSSGKLSQWMVDYDHITNLTVKKGDHVVVGQKLGVVAQNGAVYRYELQVINGRSQSLVCPTNLLDSAIRATYSSQLDQFVNEWEAWYGKTVYPQQVGGCVVPTLTNEESQGQ